MERFRFIRKIGRGAHGTVYLLETTDEKKKKVVCKSILRKYWEHAEREIEILSSTSHRRIVGFVDSFLTGSGISIILEYLNHGTLEEMIRYFLQSRHRASNHLIWSVLAQIADGLMYLHGKQIIHRDIKPSNILVNQASFGNKDLLEFKLCDFSLAKRFKDIDGAFGVVGTPSYMAPEVISKQPYDASVDVWGLGVTLYELSTLNKPFEGRSRDELYQSIKKAKLPPGIICTDGALERLIRKCLCKDNRISVRALSCDWRIRFYLAILELRLRSTADTSGDFGTPQRY